LFSVEVKSKDEVIGARQEFDIEKEIQIHIKAEYFSGEADFCFFIADMMNNRLFGDAVFKDKAVVLSAGIYDFVWTIPPNVLNEGVFKLGILLLDEKNNPVYSMMELLTFMTIDRKNPIDDFGLYVPMKPQIEFTYKATIVPTL